MIKPKIFIGVASSGRVWSQFNLCCSQLVAYFQSECLAPEIEEQFLTVQHCVSSNICYNYHALVLMAQKWGATHFLTLEEDNGFMPNVLHILYRKQQLWVGCNYPMKNDKDWTFTAAKLDGTGRVLTEEKSYGLEACAYTGMGVALFSMQVFELVSKPWFLMPWLDNDIYGTQDAYFGQKCREKGIIPFVDHDASKLIWHIGDKNFNWKDCSDGQRSALKNNDASNS